jgi:putative inorganic carbon (HCO3(-)) transporter
VSVVSETQREEWWTDPRLLGGTTLALMLAALFLVVLQKALMGAVLLALALAGAAVLGSPGLLVPIAVFVLYTNAAVVATHFHGAPGAFAVAPLLLLAVPAARDVVLRGKKIVITPTLVLLFCFIAVQIVGAFIAVRPHLALGVVFTWLVEGLLLYFIVTNAVRTTTQLRQAIWGLLAAGAFIGGLSFLQQMTGAFDNEFYGFAQVSDAAFKFDGSPENLQPRLAGPVGEKNRYAQIMAILLPVALFQYWSEPRRVLRMLALASLTLTAIGFALAFSRGAAVGVGLMLVVLVVRGYVRWDQLALVAVAVLAMALVAPQYTSRLGSLVEVVNSAIRPAAGNVSDTDGATRGRLTEMRSAALVFANHPLLGVGPGMNRVHYRRYAEIVGGRIATSERRSHSLYLGLAAEQGLVGLAFFGAILVATFRGLNQVRRSGGGRELQMMAMGLEVALIAYLANSIFLHFAYIRYFWLMMGLAGAAHQIALRPAAEPTAAT